MMNAASSSAGRIDHGESEYIVTFFTHFDALQCVQTMGGASVRAKLAPVPRALSSSCGSCARFCSGFDPLPLLGEDYEQLFRVEGEAYSLLSDNR